MRERIWGDRGGYWAPLGALFVDNVVIRNDILEKKPGDAELSEKEKKGILQESELTYRRWESERGRNVDSGKKPMLPSTERVTIQGDRQMGRNE